MGEVVREWVGIDSPSAPRQVFGGYPHEGVYHAVKGHQPEVAFLVGHPTGNFKDHYLAPYLANKGFGVLGWTTRYKNAPAYFQVENALVDLGAGVQWLREVAGVKKVVLVGNSGGGSFYATYQAQATDPNSIRVDEQFKSAATEGTNIGGQISRVPATKVSVEQAVRQLSPADLYISLNSHQGRADVLTTWLDPSVIDETDLFATDPDLDMFNPRNGPPYSPEFLTRYRRAQVDRNHRISAWARKELAELNSRGVADRVFLIYRQFADPRFADLSIDPSEREAGCFSGDPRTANYGPHGLAPFVTLRGWLSMWSLEDSQFRGTGHFGKVRVPSLVIQSTRDQGVFPSDAHAIHDALGASDKTLKFLSAGHYFEDNSEVKEEAATVIADWTSARV